MRLFAGQFTKKEAENKVRRKRDTYTNAEEEEEEDQVIYREELGFGLSTAGGVVGWKT